MNETPVTQRNARLGLALFSLYLAFYGAFVWLSAFRADWMATRAIGGVNVAILYGFALILGAFVLALFYLVLCKPDDEADAGSTGS